MTWAFEARLATEPAWRGWPATLVEVLRTALRACRRHPTRRAHHVAGTDADAGAHQRDRARPAARGRAPAGARRDAPVVCVLAILGPRRGLGRARPRIEGRRPRSASGGGVARLRPGASLAAAQQQVAATSARLRATCPLVHRDLDLRAQSLHARVIGDVQPLLWRARAHCAACSSRCRRTTRWCSRRQSWCSWSSG